MPRKCMAQITAAKSQMGSHGEEASCIVALKSVFQAVQPHLITNQAACFPQKGCATCPSAPQSGAAGSGVS